jgi:hypothetical protein
MPIRFKQDYTVADESRNDQDNARTFKADEEVDFEALYAEETPDPSVPEADRAVRNAQRAKASEDHFVNRGLAVRVGDEDQPKRKAKATPQQAQQAARDQQREQQAQRQQEQAAPQRHPQAKPKE